MSVSQCTSVGQGKSVVWLSDGAPMSQCTSISLCMSASQFASVDQCTPVSQRTTAGHAVTMRGGTRRRRRGIICCVQALRGKLRSCKTARHLARGVMAAPVCGLKLGLAPSSSSGYDGNRPVRPSRTTARGQEPTHVRVKHAAARMHLYNVQKARRGLRTRTMHGKPAAENAPA